MAQAADKFQEQMDSMARRMVRTNPTVLLAAVCPRAVVLHVVVGAAMALWVDFRDLFMRETLSHSDPLEKSRIFFHLACLRAGIVLRSLKSLAVVLCGHVL